MGSEYATGGEARREGGGMAGLGQGDGRQRRKKGLVKAGVDAVVDWVGETGALLDVWGGERRRRF